jgi:hypothetical protein
MPPNENSDMFVSPRAWSVSLASPAEASAPEITDEPGLFRRAVLSQPSMNEQVSADTIDRFVAMVMSLDLLTTVLFQRIYLGVSITLATHFIAMGVLFLGGRLRFSGIRIVLYWLLWGGAFVLLMLSGNTFSSSSILLGAVCYISFLAVAPASQQTYFEVIKVYQKIALGIAAIVFLQLALQVAGLGMPSMDGIVPVSLTPPTMNYTQQIDWHAGITKPNGFFMFEASYTSQLLATALMIELSFFRRWTWLLAFVLALLGTFSGTGLMLILLTLPVLAKRFWKSLLVYGIVLLPLLGSLAVATGWYETAAKRAETFDVKGSSAHDRFVGPFEAMYDVLISGDTHRIIYGFGAGSTAEIIPGVELLEYNAVSKALIEYGILFLIMLLVFTTYCIFSSGAPFIIAYLAILEYHFMGGHLLLPPIINYCYILGAGWAIIPPAGARRARA